MGEIKGFLIATFAALISFFMPIGDFIVAMILLFAVNFCFGLLADIVNGGGWQMKKAMQFFVQCFVFFVLAFCIFSIGEKMHAHQEAISGVKYLCTVALWFFSVNIARNWMNITPKRSVFHKIAYFIYYVLSVQFVERIPFLKRFIAEKQAEAEPQRTEQTASAMQKPTQPKEEQS